MKPESSFRKRVDQFIRTLPFCKSLSIQQKAISGHPDKILCLAGWFVALEIKTDEGKPSARQVLVLQNVLKAKGVALIVRPSNFEEVKEILQKISRGIRYDSNEIQGLTSPKFTNDLGENRKHTNGSGKKLRSKQASSSSTVGDQESAGGEQRAVEDFREI
jgi:hypothetical protein